MAMLKIGATSLPNPTEYVVYMRDGDSENTKRDETWYMHRERVRSNMYAIDATWEVSGASYKALVEALDPAKISLTFFNPKSATYITVSDFYRGDVTCTLLQYLDETSPEKSQWQISTTFTNY